MYSYYTWLGYAALTVTMMTALFLDEAFSELDKKTSAKTIRCEGKSM